MTAENYCLRVSQGMNKYEVADYLRVSTKTVERYVKSGKLKTVYVAGKAMFEKEDVMALEEELKMPVHRAIPVEDNRMETTETSQLSLSVAAGERIILMQLVQELIEEQKNKRLYQKLTITIEEAAKISGFSKKGLLEAAKAGRFIGVKQGGSWRFRYIDLVAFVDSHFVATGNVQGKDLTNGNGKFLSNNLS
ncbi:MAG: helix-turn-helix domain-containing protein [Cyanomargarita calcarea GSE-NOS-MK-12-04C]|jgi:excisionase family DNA binding protein|uniref:Helix-turn-helix domain-containing protein n=1 Tax=Cyanomargarita calcarea GSE-NOS-MK-12-04C TaxID=2839659 RepID=A0A951QNV7_9CYAN|nr:helix-turn-helix domain-containing protein [Cyanomargarita calcarea GSE-NOS-MK-12-04C]